MMSALNPKADMDRRSWDVRFVPIADMALRPDRWARALVSRLNKSDPGTAIMQRPLICRGSFMGGNQNRQKRHTMPRYPGVIDVDQGRQLPAMEDPCHRNIVSLT